MAIQWPLAIFTTLAGTGAWLLIFALVDFWAGKSKEPALFQRSLVFGFVIVGLGGLASVFHLSHPENIVGALNHPTSDIFLEILGVAFVCLFALILFFMGKRGVSQGSQKGFGVLLAAACLYLSFVSGYGYVMAAQPYWNTLLMPAMYMATAALSGATLFMLVIALTDPKKAAASAADGAAGDGATEGKAGFWTWLLGAAGDFDKKPLMKLMGTIAAIVGVIAVVVVAAYIATTGVLALTSVVPFVVLILAGVVLAAVCGYLGSRRGNFTSSVSVAFVCGFIGCLMVRVLMFASGVGTYDFFAQNFFAMI